MKRFIAIVIAATAAIVTLTASISAADNNSAGTVSFESSSMPTLNCTVSIAHAKEIYRLIPGNIADICEKEYVSVQRKCSTRSHFTHEGVDIRVSVSGETVTIIFSVSGYKVTASNVTWNELDNIFLGRNERG